MAHTKEEFLAYLQEKAKGNIRGNAKLVIDGEFAVFLDETGAVPCELVAEADVTMIASQEVFENIVSGEQNAAMAFMSGKLKVEGNNMRALKISDILTEKDS